MLYLLLGLWWSLDLDLGRERLVDDAIEWAGPWCEGIRDDILSDCMAND